jgi:ribulose-5-phosphate 4-epimerase/fuculose-1-phosphate aldolase
MIAAFLRRGDQMAQVTEDVLRQQLADCHRMMVMAELLDYSGHVSARVPGTNRALILPRDASRASVTADEMLVVDFDGNVLDGKGPAPTETAIHLAVYRAREDVRAIGHGHPPMSTLFTMIDRPMFAMRNFGFRFIGCPCHPDPTHIRTLEQGAAVAKTLGNGKYCLLRGHGSVIAVDSVPEVFLDSLEMEENAKSAIHASTLGGLRPITPEEVELLKPSFSRNTYRVGKTWEHYREKARRAGYL